MTPRPVTTAPSPTTPRALSRLRGLDHPARRTRARRLRHHRRPRRTPPGAGRADRRGAARHRGRDRRRRPAAHRQADATAEGDAKAAAAARAEVLTGDALSVANAEAAPRRHPGPRPPTSPRRPSPPIVAQSQGRQWPRAILASTLDEATNTQCLHVMVSEKPDQPFRIASSVPMFGGAELPALGAQLAGAPLLDAGDEERPGRLARRGRRGLRRGHRAAEGQGHRGGRCRRPVRDRAQDRGRGPGQGPRQARQP